MESLLTQLPYAGVVISIVVVILGIAAGLYMLEAYRSKKVVYQNEADDRLNKILKDTVDELSKKVDSLEKREKELTLEVGELRKENERYLSILQGRDKDTQEFYKKSLESIETAKSTHEMVQTLLQTLTDTNKNLEELIDVLKTDEK